RFSRDWSSDVCSSDLCVPCRFRFRKARSVAAQGTRSAAESPVRPRPLDSRVTHHGSFDEHPLTRGLHRYSVRHPEESADVAAFLALLQTAHREPVFTRSALVGHFTGSAWLVDRSGMRVLLTHHRKLDRWLQLGGHADGEEDLARVALREAAEESGLRDLAVDADIFDIDRHRIPARGDEPGHWHYDVRHVVRCRGSED